MGIGTSLGAYFETDFDHHAGNNFKLEQDKNVIDPAESLANKYKDEPLEGTFSGGYDNNEITDSAVMRSLVTKPKVIPIANLTNTSEPVDPSHYDTMLTPEQETKFQDWKSKMAPNDSGHDYDLRGAFLNNVSPDKESGHWPDTFKKPNHPTFSDQSMYAGERPDLAGRWQGETYIPPSPMTDM